MQTSIRDECLARVEHNITKTGFWVSYSNSFLKQGLVIGDVHQCISLSLPPLILMNNALQTATIRLAIPWVATLSG
jgi:hypothetical protein